MVIPPMLTKVASENYWDCFRSTNDYIKGLGNNSQCNEKIASIGNIFTIDLASHLMNYDRTVNGNFIDSISV